MQDKGINYDTGFLNAGASTRDSFDARVVRREMQIIRDDLHCTAVRVTGGDLDRLEIAASQAVDAGLAAWVCPFTSNLTQDALLELLADCAGRAERLRERGGEIVMFTGSELSLTTVGFFPGDTLAERIALIADPLRVRSLIADVRARINAFLPRAAHAVRQQFGGRVSYASLPLERVDWTPFDIISTDAGYRSKATAAQFPELIRAFVAQGRTSGKPVGITEFGCMTFRGAADNMSSDIHSLVEWDAGGHPLRLKGEYVRDEAEQATYLREVLNVFDTEGVDSAFVYTFARYDLPHRTELQTDLDMVSCGVVKVRAGEARDNDPRQRRYPDMPWDPKAAFDALADIYRR
jgi:hypothetical protein